MQVTLLQVISICIVILLIYSLYKELLNPTLTFAIAVIIFMSIGVLTPSDILKGFSNEQLIVIFLLILVTSGIRHLYGAEIYNRFFKKNMKPKSFLLRMMIGTSTVSAFLNNTPVVGFMIPYVKDWAENNGTPSSKLLIPLSFATIMGGMITVIGTSTNLVLMGLMTEYGLTPLHFTDFLYLGILVTVAGWIYLYFVGYKLLPSHGSNIKLLRKQVKEYIVETELYSGSPLAGKSVKEASLKNLKDLYLAEIVRNDRIISPVGPEVILEEEDKLFFSGHTQAIMGLLKEDYGLQFPRHGHIINGSGANGHFNFVEAVIPSNSDLIGLKIKDSDFRNKFNASIVAIHRNGKRISGRVGEVELSGGDFLLLLSGHGETIKKNDKDLYLISIPKKVDTQRPSWHKWMGLGSLLVLIMGAIGIFPLFNICIILLGLLVLTGILNSTEIKQQLDLNLFLILVCSLAIGLAIDKSGIGYHIAYLLTMLSGPFGDVGLVVGLFFFTILLTSLITNPAAVAMMFPIALSIAKQSQLEATPLFVAIAFAASGDFITPIGYQTNLMVFGPGGYTFKDFVKVGAPLTLLYSIICITFITKYYNLA